MDPLKSRALDWIEERSGRLTQIADAIWSHPELAMEERRSSALLAEELERGGFAVERGVAGMPTAFVATWGSGAPAIGFLCEYDALPGLSNEAAAERKPVAEGGPGHACGHNLIGTGSMAAGLAVRAVLEAEGLAGTLKVFGTPAEETLAGKVFMAREGVFDGLDACLSWHPYGRNRATYESSLALLSVRFLFEGKTCHIPSRPNVGRNALDAAELMNVAANLRRKHFPPGTSLEYVILDGGSFPNVSPDRAEVWYFLRGPTMELVEENFREIRNAARGAAIATGTEVKMRIVTACYSYLPNKTVAEVLYENLQIAGPPRFTEGEKAFARALQRTMDAEMDEPLDEGVELHGEEMGFFSQDDGDLSWFCPVARVRTACWPHRIASHTWQATASTGSSIGHKGMLAAAKTLALAGLDLFTRPEVLRKAADELKRRAQGRAYRCLVPPEVKPTGEPPLAPLPD